MQGARILTACIAEEDIKKGDMCVVVHHIDKVSIQVRRMNKEEQGEMTYGEIDNVSKQINL